MPKRHRQPEPVHPQKVGRADGVDSKPRAPVPQAAPPTKTQRAPPRATRSIASTADSLASSSIGVFPAAPSALPEKKRHQNARHAGVRAVTAGDADATMGTSGSSSIPDSQSLSEAMSYDSSLVGDDGNQDYYGSHSDEDVSISDSEQDDMRAMRVAVRANRAAAASRRKGRAFDLAAAVAGSTSTDSEGDSNASEEERRHIDDEGPFDMDAPIQQLTTSSSDDDEEASGDEDSSEAEDDDDLSLDEEQGIYESDEEHDDDDDDDTEDGEDEEDDGDDSDREQVTVDFGVYDMEAKHVDAVMHLMDQLCPDKMNEVDRDELGAAFAENPYTYVVKVGDNDDESASTGAQTKTSALDDEEEEEFYGLVSVLSVHHGLERHAAAFRPLQTLLKEEVWRTVHPGLPPTEMLTATTDDTAKLAKCGLLVTEYIRNVPVELSVQILEDLVHRLEKATPSDASPAKKQRGKKTAEGDKDMTCVRFTQPCLFAVLAKVQRAVDAPVTLTKKSQKKGRHAQPSSSETDKDEKLDLDAYIFWREEDRILFRFRDSRIATYAYRCRPQYDGQPEQEIPISLLFVLQHGALLQAIDEIKKQDLTKTEVTRFY